MAFATYETPKSNTDWDKLNQHVVETADMQEPTPIAGYISMICDLGPQPQEDAKMVWKGTPQEEAEAIAKYPSTYFEDGVDHKGNPCRHKRWPVKDEHCIAVAVDFPSIIVDKGQFMGESKPLPLRLWFGRKNKDKDSGLMIVQNPFSLRPNTKDLGSPTLGIRSNLYSLAVAAKLVKNGEAFPPNRVDELLGKSFLFNVQVYFKPGKTGGSFYTENISFATALMKGMPEPQQIVKPILVQMYEKPTVDLTKALPQHVINTMMRSSKYPGSEMEKIFGESKVAKAPSSEAQKPAAPAPAVQQKAPVTAKAFADDLDDDIPF